MNLTMKIKDDYGTVKRFARLHKLNLKSTYMTLNHYPRLKVVQVLITKGYIQSINDLGKAA